MKKLLVLGMVLVSVTSYGQKYVSKKQHINTINNQYIESSNSLYIAIDDDKIKFTNKKGDKVFDEFKLGETKKGDEIIKYSLEVNDEKKVLIRKSLDTFTNKSSKLVYELTLVE